MSKKSWLTPQQRTFARAYVKTSDVAKASREAGYRANAHHLLEWPAIKDQIDVLQRNAMNRARLTIDKILNDLEDVRMQAMEKGQLMIALKALEMQGKHIGLWREQTTYNTKNETTYNVNFVSTQEIAVNNEDSKSIEMTN